MAGAALAELCQIYWAPLYGFVRSRGHTVHDAQDLTQSFFAYVLEHKVYARADRQKGRFRSFLLASLKNFLADAADKERTLKRGGAQIFLPLHEEQAQEAESLFQTHSGMSNEDRLFDRSWAEALVATVLERLLADYKREGKEQLFTELRMFVAGGAEPPPSYAELGHRLGVAESTLRSHVTRLRARYREALRAEVRRTVDTKPGRSRVARVAPRTNGIVRNARDGKTAAIWRQGVLDMRQAVKHKRRLPGLPVADGIRPYSRRN